MSHEASDPEIQQQMHEILDLFAFVNDPTQTALQFGWGLK